MGNTGKAEGKSAGKKRPAECCSPVRFEGAMPQQDERFFQFLIANSPAAIIAYNREGVIEFAGGKVLAIWERKPEDMVGRHISEICDHPDKVMKSFRRAMSGESFRTYGQAQGRHIEIQYSPRRDADGQITGVIVVDVDVTECMQTEHALRESERRLRLIMDNATDAISISIYNPHTRQRKLLMCNDRYVEMSGRSREELMATEDVNLFKRWVTTHGPPARDQILRGLPSSGTTSWIRPDGKENYYEWTVSPFKVDDQIHIIGIDRDITERKRSEVALQQKNIALREVLARIEEEKQAIGRMILNNVDKIVMPLIHELEWELPPHQQRHISLLKDSLREIAFPFADRLSGKTAMLTPTEVHICDLIRRGLPTKDIARLKHTSPATVSKQREHIRRKLGIKNKKVNLATFLDTMLSSRVQDSRDDDGKDLG